MKNKQLHIVYLAITGFFLAAGASSCSNSDKQDALSEAAYEMVATDARESAYQLVGESLAKGAAQAPAVEESEADAEPEATPAEVASRHARLMALLTPEDTVRAHNPYESHLDTMPPGGVKMKINSIGGTLGRVLNDSNKFHLEVAMANGITPLQSIEDVWQQAGKLEKLHTCESYYLDNLTHSIPYLVPKAHRLLKDIGNAFRDSLRSRGGGDYRIKVTSVLRTPALVKQLRRRNRNAVDTSAHLYGTTFDITYLKFICNSSDLPRTQEDLKNLLGEVVEDMRRQQRCYVKYERKQSCYHITVR
jgi:uncharacterized protein YcbK (DUF882 family)